MNQNQPQEEEDREERNRIRRQRQNKERKEKEENRRLRGGYRSGGIIKGDGPTNKGMRGKGNKPYQIRFPSKSQTPLRVILPTQTLKAQFRIHKHL